MNPGPCLDEVRKGMEATSSEEKVYTTKGRRVTWCGQAWQTQHLFY